MIVPAKLPERQRKGNQTSDDGPKGGQRDDVARRATTQTEGKGKLKRSARKVELKIQSILLKTPGC